MLSFALRLATTYKRGRRTIQRWIRERGFPRPVELSPGTVRFRRHEVDAWERAQIGKRDGETPLSSEEAFQQLNEVLTEVLDIGDFAVEMHRQNEKRRDDPECYVPGPITFADLYSAYHGCLRDPATSNKTKEATERRPQLAALLRSCNPVDR